MSYGIMAYAVDLEIIKALLGSGDKQAFAILRRKYSADLDQLDQDISDPGDDGYLPTGKILYRMIMEPELPTDLQGTNRAKMLYAFEKLCRANGQPLDNGYWSGMRMAWFDTVDEELKRAGVDFATSDLIYERSVLVLPHADDFPNVGIWGRTYCQTALKTLEAAPLERMEHDQARAAVEEIRSWFRICTEKNVDLVCFYY